MALRRPLVEINGIISEILSADAARLPNSTLFEAGLGTQGGEFQFEKPPTSTLAGNVVLELVGDGLLQFFENGGAFRAFSLNFTETAGTSKIYHQGFKPTKADVGLGLVDNTSDASKPVSTAQATAINARLPLSGGAMTGGLKAVPSVGSIAGGSTTTVEVVGAGGVGDAAYMLFHRPNQYAVYFGLDIDNKLKFGGFSAGANAYALYTEANKPTKADVGLGLADNTSDASKSIGGTAANASALGNVPASKFLRNDTAQSINGDFTANGFIDSLAAFRANGNGYRIESSDAAAVDSKRWDLIATGKQLQLRTINDAYTASGETVFTATRTGMSVTSLVFGAPTTFLGAVGFNGSNTFSGSATFESATIARSGAASTSIAAMAGAGTGVELQARGSGLTAGAAVASFHRPGVFASFFGIDTDNIWKVGGWSMGANSYPIFHAGYQPAIGQVTGLANELGAKAPLASPSFTGSSLRLKNGGRGVLYHQDADAFYLLTTDANDADGGFNGLRPFNFSLATGDVNMAHNVAVGALHSLGPIFVKANPSTNWGIDSTGVVIELASGGTFDLPAGSGEVILHANQTGRLGHFTLEAGQTFVPMNSSGEFATTPTAGKISIHWTGAAYRITNNAVTTAGAPAPRTLYVRLDRIRPFN